MLTKLFEVLTSPSDTSATPLPRLLAAGAFLLLYLLGFIAWRVGRPHVVKVPEDLEQALYLIQNASAFRTERKHTVIFAGSFNPITNGHIAMLKFLAAKHSEGKVIAVVGFNPTKKYDVSPEQRVEMIARACADDPDLKNVTAVTCTGYIWRYAFKEKVHRMYRGIRSWDKDGAEEMWLNVLNTVGPILLAMRAPLETHYLQSSGELVEVSSTRVRKMAQSGGGSAGSLSGLVPKSIEWMVLEAYGRRSGGGGGGLESGKAKVRTRTRKAA